MFFAMVWELEPAGTCAAGKLLHVPRVSPTKPVVHEMLLDQSLEG